MAGRRDPAERCSCRSTDCVERPLRRLFEGLASGVAAWPWPFVLVPLLLSGGLGAGFLFLPRRQANDIEGQFTPTWGPAKAERDFVRRHFPPDVSERFSAPRLPTEGAYAALIAVATNGTSVLDPAAWADVLRLNATVHDADYERLCARTAGRCASPNALLSRLGHAGPPAPGSLRFPVSDGVFLGAALGGVETEGGRVRRARALKLLYYLREDGPEAQDSRRWLQRFLRDIPSKVAESRLGSVQVTYFTSLSRQQEFEGNTRSVIPLFSITYFLTIAFAVISCLR
ncbi:PTHD3 protein, partial [Acrocephalus arundinaceus]|nr:PTHD3 protein [Acrocephalus arundinaceus]